MTFQKMSRELELQICPYITPCSFDEALRYTAETGHLYGSNREISDGNKRQDLRISEATSRSTLLQRMKSVLTPFVSQQLPMEMFCRSSKSGLARHGRLFQNMMQMECLKQRNCASILHVLLAIRKPVTSSAEHGFSRGF